MQHLRNVWIGSTEKALTSELNNILCVSLEEIDPRIRVSSYISAVIHAVDKEFSDNTNVEIRSLSVVKHVINNIMRTALMGRRKTATYFLQPINAVLIMLLLTCFTTDRLLISTFVLSLNSLSTAWMTALM